jgi:hypothetical protein
MQELIDAAERMREEVLVWMEESKAGTPEQAKWFQWHHDLYDIGTALRVPQVRYNESEILAQKERDARVAKSKATREANKQKTVLV